MLNERIIGRDAHTDHVIVDPQNRVSRRHAKVVILDNGMTIEDLGSMNGTYVNQVRLGPGKPVPVTFKDQVTLSTDYVLDLSLVVNADDHTRILPSGTDAETTILSGSSRSFYKEGNRVVEFDRDRSSIGEIVQADRSPFLKIGRNEDNDLVIAAPNISRHHCKIRLLTPFMIEIEDLGATNGTFADGERLQPNVPVQYASSVKIRLGSSYELDLRSVIPGIEVIVKKESARVAAPAVKPLTGAATEQELRAFSELENLWKEYSGRQTQASNRAMGFSIGGTVLGLAASALLPGIGTIAGGLVSTGSGLFGRFIGQQESNKIRNDLTYEDMFLQTYCCPRCNESFQKKPWITIRECFRCKTKYR